MHVRPRRRCHPEGVPPPPQLQNNRQAVGAWPRRRRTCPHRCRQQARGGGLDATRHSSAMVSTAVSTTLNAELEIWHGRLSGRWEGGWEAPLAAPQGWQSHPPGVEGPQWRPGASACHPQCQRAARRPILGRLCLPAQLRGWPRPLRPPSYPAMPPEQPPNWQRKPPSPHGVDENTEELTALAAAGPALGAAGPALTAAGPALAAVASVPADNVILDAEAEQQRRRRPVRWRLGRRRLAATGCRGRREGVVVTVQRQRRLRQPQRRRGRRGRHHRQPDTDTRQTRRGGRTDATWPRGRWRPSGSYAGGRAAGLGDAMRPPWGCHSVQKKEEESGCGAAAGWCAEGALREKYMCMHWSYVTGLPS